MDVEMQLSSGEHYDMMLAQAEKFIRYQKVLILFWVLSLVCLIWMAVIFHNLKARLDRVEDQLHHYTVPTGGTIDNTTV
jgi:hypothetical protein